MRILNFIRRMFGRHNSIDSITAPMGKILRDLDAYSSKQAERAGKADAKADALRVHAKNARNEASAAQKLASNYKSLITPETA